MEHVPDIFRFVMGSTYYGISMHTGDLGGNPYVTFILSAVVDLPSYLLAMWLFKRYGRYVIYFLFFSFLNLFFGSKFIFGASGALCFGFWETLPMCFKSRVDLSLAHLHGQSLICGATGALILDFR